MVSSVPNRQQLIEYYRQLSDEQLRKLSESEPDELRPQALEILEEELRRRGFEEQVKAIIERTRARGDNTEIEPEWGIEEDHADLDVWVLSEHEPGVKPLGAKKGLEGKNREVMQQQPFEDYTRDVFHGAIWIWDWFRRRPGHTMDIFALSGICPKCRGEVDHSPGDSEVACADCDWRETLPEEGRMDIGGWILHRIRQRIRSDDWKQVDERLRAVGGAPPE